VLFSQKTGIGDLSKGGTVLKTPINGSKKVFLFCWMVLIVATSVPGFPSTEPHPQGEIRINRLVSLCKLWGLVKYFHPWLAYRTDIDWDSALVMTIPKVITAETADQYANAMEGLLSVLGDPASRISRRSSFRSDDNRRLESRLTEDGILVITVGDYFELWSQKSNETLSRIVADVPKAKAIIFDLRSSKPVGEYGRFQLGSSFSQVERSIFSMTLLAPGERSRLHKGFETASVFSSGQYRSGFFIQNAKRLVPAQNGKDTPSIFVLNENSGILDSTLALQANGKALIVFEGDVRNSSIVKTETLDLGEGLSAEVRLVEPIFEDGTSADLRPDVVIPTANEHSEATLDAALQLARDFKPSMTVRRRLPAIAVRIRDKSYSEMKYPSREYRLLAAFRIWNNIHYFFPYKHLMGEDWDRVLRDFIPRIEQSKDALDYSLAVAEMMTNIHDSHAYISGEVINDHFGTGYPPIRVRLIENSLVVTHFYDPAIARQAGLEVGDIVVRVDGEDAKTRLARYSKYFSSSTPQSRIDKATVNFMSGKGGSFVTLNVRDSNNLEKEIKLPRKAEDFSTLYHRERAGEIFKLLPGSIGYADLDRLRTEMIDEMFEMFRNTRAIIFDMRGYPNGTVWSLVPRLTEKPQVTGAYFETPLIGPASTARASEAFYQTIAGRSADKWIYKSPTVMLIDERSQSQAEHTGLFLRAANGTQFVGSSTAGANGEITNFSVPGGIAIGFSGQSVKFPDGRQLQRIGLSPDVEVRPTIKGIREGRDEVLDRAIKYLSER
jgi:C-terminal processing protease CtpA/Prc